MTFSSKYRHVISVGLRISCAQKEKREKVICLILDLLGPFWKCRLFILTWYRWPSDYNVMFQLSVNCLHQDSQILTVSFMYPMHWVLTFILATWVTPPCWSCIVTHWSLFTLVESIHSRFLITTKIRHWISKY